MRHGFHSHPDGLRPARTRGRLSRLPGGKHFPWLRRSWLILVLPALGIYAGLGVLEALLRNVFGLGQGFGVVDAWTLRMLCCLLPAISGCCLWFGYMVAVVHCNYRDRDWGRLHDLWRRT